MTDALAPATLELRFAVQQCLCLTCGGGYKALGVAILDGVMGEPYESDVLPTLNEALREAQRVRDAVPLRAGECMDLRECRVVTHPIELLPPHHPGSVRRPFVAVPPRSRVVGQA